MNGEEKKQGFDEYMLKATDNLKEMAVNLTAGYAEVIKDITDTAYNGMETIVKVITEDRVNERQSRSVEEIQRNLNNLKEYMGKMGDAFTKIADSLSKYATTGGIDEQKEEQGEQEK